MLIKQFFDAIQNGIKISFLWLFEVIVLSELSILSCSLCPIYTGIYNKISWNFISLLSHSSDCERDQLRNFAHGYEWLVMFELRTTEWRRLKILLISD